MLLFIVRYFCKMKSEITFDICGLSKMVICSLTNSFTVSFPLQHGGAKTCRDSRHHDGLHADRWLGNGSRIFICYHHESLTGLSNCSPITSSWIPMSSTLGGQAAHTLRSSCVAVITVEFMETPGLVSLCGSQSHSFVF